MNLLFPAGLAILLILFLVTNFDLVSTVVGYLLMICLIVIVGGAIGYGLYQALGPQIAILLGLVAAGVWLATKAGYSLDGFLRGFVAGYRTGPGGKA
ncbi:MAG: hypothetical protein IT489_07190 [Gammaproteobacteria bacterium]|nr:hypothetical protein [Gammaproteobacteria bacterium]